MGCSSSKSAGHVAADAHSDQKPAPPKQPAAAEPVAAAAPPAQPAAEQVLPSVPPPPRPADMKEISERPKVIFVLGGPGSGKGTQCAKILEKYGGGCRHLSTGELLRAEAAKGTELGQQLEATMKAGGLVSDEQVLALLEREVSGSAWFGLAFLIDGFPRTLGQATAFEQRVRPADAVLFFSAPDEVLRARLAGRAGAGGRSDDTPEAAGARLADFHAQSEPVAEHFEREGKLHRISAEPAADEVFREVAPLLDGLLQPGAPPTGAGTEWRAQPLLDIEKRFYGDRD